MLRRSILTAGILVASLPAFALAQTTQDRTTPSQDRAMPSQQQPTTGQDRTYDTRSRTGQDMNQVSPAAGQSRDRGYDAQSGQEGSGRTTTGQSATGQDLNQMSPAAGNPADMKALASGHRASKLIGQDVVNESNETVGSIDDLVLTQDNKIQAIVSVGGFLGMGERLVAVPMDQLQMRDDEFVMRNATKDSLQRRPEFKYQNENR